MELNNISGVALSFRSRLVTFCSKSHSNNGLVASSEKQYGDVDKHVTGFAKGIFYTRPILQL